MRRFFVDGGGAAGASGGAGCDGSRTSAGELMCKAVPLGQLSVAIVRDAVALATTIRHNLACPSQNDGTMSEFLRSSDPTPAGLEPRRTEGVRRGGRSARVVESVLRATVEELGTVGYTAL